MRPLAAPVVGGMVSSFLHIMIVTPVLFAWLRQRELKLRPAPGGTRMRRPQVELVPAACAVESAK
jgi:hypothetical protein